MSISKRKREAVYVYNEGRSSLTGDHLGVDWQLDHRKPKAKGGSDEIDNLQALTEMENRMKAAAYPPDPLGWQREFLNTWEHSSESSFLLVALPGTGKTIAALYAAQDWITEAPQRRRVIIVVPTDPLRTQWQNVAAVNFGLQFQTKEFTRFKSGMIGGIYTYQLLCSQTELCKLICAEHEVLVIGDEIHHCGKNDWGLRFREAFTSAKRRLLTSGTPFRGDSARIPFVHYDGEGRCVTDFPFGFRYDYPQAIRDQVIRVVCFQHEKGSVRCAGSGGVQTLEISTDVSEAEADEALGRILEPGAFTEELLRLGHERLMRVRQSMPNAGGLVICKDQRHAQHIATQLHRLTGTAPAVVVSDDDKATSDVDLFRASSETWVVAVRQISEGVDIKRLIVLVYLTNFKTALFFRQAVGRIVRFMGGEDLESYCVIPSHPSLVAHAIDIVNAQVQAIEEEPDDDEPPTSRDPRALPATPDFMLSSEHLGSGGVIIEGEVVDSSIAAAVERIALELKLPQSKAFLVWKKYEGPSRVAPAPPPPARAAVLEKQLDDRRKEFARVARKAAYRLFGNDDPEAFKKTYTLVHQQFHKRSIEYYSLDDLNRAITHARGLGR